MTPPRGETDALVILNHPNGQEPPHYRRERLGEKRFFAGIEIYNAVIELLGGTALVPAFSRGWGACGVPDICFGAS